MMHAGQNWNRKRSAFQNRASLGGHKKAAIREVNQLFEVIGLSANVQSFMHTT